jgi:hypothetical protein
MGRAIASAKEGDKKAAQASLSLADTLMKESLSQANDAKLVATAMSKSLATQMKSFSPQDLQDPVVKKHLDTAKGLVDDAVAKVKALATPLSELSKGVTEIQTILKTKK